MIFQHCVNYERYRRSILCIPLTTTTPLTCGYWLEIPYFVHYMCIGADLNQDHFSQLLAARPRQAFFPLSMQNHGHFSFYLHPHLSSSLGQQKKKKLFFSLCLFEWSGSGSSLRRKHGNIRQSAAPKLINLLSSRFWLWREHISAFTTTAGWTSMLKGRELFHSIREGISHSSSRTLQLPFPSLSSPSDGVKIYWTSYKTFFSAYTQQWTYECVVGICIQIDHFS